MGHSPIVEGMNFAEAIEQIVAGRKVTKREWNEKNVFCYLNSGHLKIFMPDKKEHDWIISEGDLKGEDWELV